MSAVVDIARNTYLSVRGKPSPVRSYLKQMMRGHTDVVREAAFFKDGRRAVTGSDDRTLQIWDVQKGVLVAGPFDVTSRKFTPVWSHLFTNPPDAQSILAYVTQCLRL